MDTFKMFIVSLSVIDNYLKKGDVMSTLTLHRCLSVNNFILYTVLGITTRFYSMCY